MDEKLIKLGKKLREIAIKYDVPMDNLSVLEFLHKLPSPSRDNKDGKRLVDELNDSKDLEDLIRIILTQP